MTPDAITPPDTKKGQRTNVEDKLRGRPAEDAKPATKHLKPARKAQKGKPKLNWD